MTTSLLHSPHEDEGECFFNPELFMNKTLAPITYRFPGLEQTVWASNASSTDHDQTGEIIWPISVFLAWFVVSQGERFRDHQAIELGAGCAGLPGLIASRFAAGVLLTDGNESVLETLKRNVAEMIEQEKTREKRGQSSTSISRSGDSTTPKGTTSNSHNSGSCKRVEASSLVWGDEKSAQAIVDDGWRPQILLGADIVCWIDFVVPLLQTVKFFFLHAREPLQAVLYLGFVNRANATERLLFTQANAMGMLVTRIPAESFLPSDKEDWPAELKDTTQKLELLAISLDPTVDGFDRTVCMDNSGMIGRATPC
eukprot:evm.model.NODE_28528_length_50078_cov_28.909842.16